MTRHKIDGIHISNLFGMNPGQPHIKVSGKGNATVRLCDGFGGWGKLVGVFTNDDEELNLRRALCCAKLWAEV
jgi:hypothetical protein